MKSKSMIDKAVSALAVIVLYTASTASTLANMNDEVILYLNDPLGSAVAAYDENGDLCWEEVHTPYGDKTVMEDSFNRQGCGVVAEERGFTGHSEDFETDLVYMQQRYYDPTIGRFLSTDPVAPIPGDPGSTNRYNYTKNSPYNYTDPTGEIPVDTVVDAGFVAWDIGKIAWGKVTNNPKLVAEGVVDLVSDSAALATPYLPAGSSRIIRFTTEKGLQANRAKGKAGEAITEAALKKDGTYAGKQVTFETSTGQRSVIDFVTNVQGGKGVVDTKTGKAVLTKGQKQLFDDVGNNRPVIPRGQNAADAGLTPGRPIVLKSCGIDRPC